MAKELQAINIRVLIQYIIFKIGNVQGFTGYFLTKGFTGILPAAGVDMRSQPLQ